MPLNKTEIAERLYLRTGTWFNIANGFYMGGIALFLYRASPDGIIPAMVTWLLVFKFGISIFTDILSGIAAEWFTRKLISTIGILITSLGFLTLAVISWLGVDQSGRIENLWWLLFVAEFLRSVGLSFISGVLDSLVIGTIKTRDPHYLPDQLKSRYSIRERDGNIIGVIFVTLMVVLVASRDSLDIVWTFIWLIPFTILIAVAAGVWKFKDSHQKAERNSLRAILALYAGNMRNPLTAMPTIAFGAWYFSGVMLIYIWPRFFEKMPDDATVQIGINVISISTVKDYFFIAMLVTGVVGARLCRRLAQPLRGIEGALSLTIAYRSIVILCGLALDCILLLGAALSMSHVLKNPEASESVWFFLLGLALIAASRATSRISWPFLSGWMHDAVKLESSRSMVASTPTAVGNLVAMLGCLLIPILDPHDLLAIISCVSFVIASTCILTVGLKALTNTSSLQK